VGEGDWKKERERGLERAEDSGKGTRSSEGLSKDDDLDTNIKKRKRTQIKTELINQLSLFSSPFHLVDALLF
jgi:hypothetical protein